MSDEIRVLERFRTELPPAEETSLLRARAALVQHATTSRSGAVVRRAPRVRRRLVLGSGLAVAVAATVVLTLPGAGSVSAAEVLDRAAAAAASQPDLPVRPGQFTYLETVETAPRNPERRVRAWEPVDGGSPAVQRVRFGDKQWELSLCAPAVAPSGQVATPPGGCPTVPTLGHPTYNYLRSLPTDPVELRKILYDQAADALGARVDHDYSAFLLVVGLMGRYVVPPGLQATLFEVIKTIPGVAAVDDVVDGGGRHGIGLTRALGKEGDRATLIVDPATYQPLGEQVLLSDGRLLTTTRLASGIVDRIGQTP